MVVSNSPLVWAMTGLPCINDSLRPSIKPEPSSSLFDRRKELFPFIMTTKFDLMLWWDLVDILEMLLSAGNGGGQIPEQKSLQSQLAADPTLKAHVCILLSAKAWHCPPSLDITCKMSYSVAVFMVSSCTSSVANVTYSFLISPGTWIGNGPIKQLMMNANSSAMLAQRMLKPGKRNGALSERNRAVNGHISNGVTMLANDFDADINPCRFPCSPGGAVLETMLAIVGNTNTTKTPKNAAIYGTQGAQAIP